jgi:hypothetical protein
MNDNAATFTIQKHISSARKRATPRDRIIDSLYTAFLYLEQEDRLALLCYLRMAESASDSVASIHDLCNKYARRVEQLTRLLDLVRRKVQPQAFNDHVEYVIQIANAAQTDFGAQLGCWFDLYDRSRRTGVCDNKLETPETVFGILTNRCENAVRLYTEAATRILPLFRDTDAALLAESIALIPAPYRKALCYVAQANVKYALQGPYLSPLNCALRSEAYMADIILLAARLVYLDATHEQVVTRYLKAVPPDAQPGKRICYEHENERPADIVGERSGVIRARCLRIARKVLRMKKPRVKVPCPYFHDYTRRIPESELPELLKPATVVSTTEDNSTIKQQPLQPLPLVDLDALIKLVCSYSQTRAAPAEVPATAGAVTADVYDKCPSCNKGFITVIRGLEECPECGAIYGSVMVDSLEFEVVNGERVMRSSHLPIHDRNTGRVQMTAEDEEHIEEVFAPNGGGRNDWRRNKNASTATITTASSRADPKVIQLVTEYMRINRLTPERLDRIQLRRILAELKKTQHYKSVNIMLQQLGAPKHTYYVMSTEQADSVAKLVSAFARTFDTVCPDNRSNRLTLTFMQRKAVEICGYKEFIPFFPLPQDGVALKTSEAIFADICAKLQIVPFTSRREDEQVYRVVAAPAAAKPSLRPQQPVSLQRFLQPVRPAAPR